MNRKHLLLAFLAVVLWGAAKGAGDDFGVLSIKAAERQSAKLGAVFTKDGNAAEIYYQQIMAFDNKDYFMALFGIDITKPENQEEKRKVETALEKGSADLMALTEASRMKSYEMWGPLIVPDGTKSLVELYIPSALINLETLGELMIAKGNSEAEAGKKDQACAWYLSAFQMGAQLERDPESLQFMSGCWLQWRAVKGMVDQGCPKADAKDLAFLDKKKQTSGMYEKMAPWDRNKVERFVKNEDMPIAFRLECLMEQYYCASSRAACHACFEKGPPDWVVKLVEEVQFSDPQAVLFLQLIKNKPTSSQYCELFPPEKE
jgi:hypothetical protein